MNSTHANKEILLPAQKCIGGLDIRELSDVELLAVMIGSGGRNAHVIDLAGEAIQRFGSIQELSRAGLREIARIRGLGLHKSLRILAAFEIGRRAMARREIVTRVDTPRAVRDLLIPDMAGSHREMFYTLVLDSTNRILKKSMVSIGTVSEAIVHPREVFRDAIREGGTSIIVSHNHPTGNIQPSKEDIASTRRIAEAGKLLGIPLLDHVIVTDEGYLSLREEGYFEN